MSADNIESLFKAAINNPNQTDSLLTTLAYVTLAGGSVI
jgi:hypothetical protein